MDPRKRNRLGATRVEVDQLAFGLVPLGNLYKTVSDEEAQAVLQAWWDAGLRTFDVAPVYGIGIAERRLGEFLQGRRRDEFIVSTKVGRPIRRGAPPDPDLTHDGDQLFHGVDPEVNPTYEYDRDAILWSLEESLSRLRLDRIDYVHIHDPDRHIREASKEAFPALAELRAQGVIGAVGTGVNWSWVGLAMAHECDLDVILLAGRYSILDQEGLRELLPLCERRGISVIDGGVFNGGFMADPKPGAMFQYQPCHDQALIDRALRIKAVCAEFDVPIKAAAIQFPTGHPAIAAVVVGASSVGHVEEIIAAFEQPIPDAFWDRLVGEALLPPGTPVPRSAVAVAR